VARFVLVVAANPRFWHDGEAWQIKWGSDDDVWCMPRGHGGWGEVRQGQARQGKVAIKSSIKDRIPNFKHNHYHCSISPTAILHNRKSNTQTLRIIHPTTSYKYNPARCLSPQGKFNFEAQAISISRY
jgi:hypothetical protein